MSFTEYKCPVYLNHITGFLPPQIVSNDDLVQWMGKSIRPSWIEKRTGIVQRHWVKESESCRNLAVQAAQKLFSKNPSVREGLGYLILASISSDYITPPTAPLIQHDLNLSGIGAFDLSAACSGFVSGLHVASALSLQNHSVLLISAEVRSKFLNPDDFATACLFGDGAATCIVRTEKKERSFRVLASQLFSDGSVGDVISIPSGGSLSPACRETDRSRFFLKMKDGAELFFKAVEGMKEAGLHFLDRCGLSSQDIQYLVPHQANAHLIEAIADRMQVSSEKLVNIISTTGNTSGSSTGLALSHLLESEKLKKGDKILLLSAGGGGLASCALLIYE